MLVGLAKADTGLALLGSELIEALENAAGNGANEIRNWLIMHAATNFAQGQTLAYAPIPDWLTGMGVFMCQSNGN